MGTKTFEFEDGSRVVFEMDDDHQLGLVIQARHLGKEFKITSAKALLSAEQLDELLGWLGDVLEEPNG